MSPSSIILPVVTSASASVLRALIGHPPKTVADLIEELQVTRTAVIAQLNNLIGAGFIEQRLEYSNTPGRPKFRYLATEKAVSCLYGGLQRYLVPSVLKHIRENMDEETFQKICTDVASDIVAPVTAHISSKDPQERLEQYVKKYKGIGRLIEFEEHEDCCLIWKYACPFVTMIDEDRVICDLDMKAMRCIADSSNVELMQSRLDGHPCCIFRLKKGNS